METADSIESQWGHVFLDVETSPLWLPGPEAVGVSMGGHVFLDVETLYKMPPRWRVPQVSQWGHVFLDVETVIPELEA